MTMNEYRETVVGEMYMCVPQRDREVELCKVENMSLTISALLLNSDRAHMAGYRSFCILISHRWMNHLHNC